LKVTLQAIEELLLVYVAVQMAKYILTPVVTNPALEVSVLRSSELRVSPGLVGVEDAETIGIINVFVLQLLQLRGTKLIYHKIVAWSHKVRAYAVISMWCLF
tara:strand:- start:1015 stop:1320 length:306 start_codon:yes stop_codon:yes gene_type:complete